MDSNTFLGQVDVNKLKPGETKVLTRTIEDLDEALNVFKSNHEYFSMAQEMWFNDEGMGITFEMGITTIPPYIITIKITKDS